MVFVFCFLFLLPSFYNSSYFILLERRVGASFTELFFASIASLKNLKIDGKLFQEVSSWRSVPAKYKGDSLTGGGGVIVLLPGNRNDHVPTDTQAQVQPPRLQI